MDLIIGKIYTFDYHSDSASKEKITTKIRMSVELEDFCRERVSSYEDNFKEMTLLAEEIVTCWDDDLKEELKKDFKEKYSSKEEKTPIKTALNLFFRNYKPENIVESKEGKITAIFAGRSATVNNIITYKWYVVGDINVEYRSITDEIEPYIEYVEV